MLSKKNGTGTAPLPFKKRDNLNAGDLPHLFSVARD